MAQHTQAIREKIAPHLCALLAAMSEEVEDAVAEEIAYCGGALDLDSEVERGAWVSDVASRLTPKSPAYVLVEATALELERPDLWAEASGRARSQGMGCERSAVLRAYYALAIEREVNYAVKVERAQDAAICLAYEDASHNMRVLAAQWCIGTGLSASEIPDDLVRVDLAEVRGDHPDLPDGRVDEERLIAAYKRSEGRYADCEYELFARLVSGMLRAVAADEHQVIPMGDDVYHVTHGEDVWEVSLDVREETARVRMLTAPQGACELLIGEASGHPWHADFTPEGWALYAVLGGRLEHTA